MFEKKVTKQSGLEAQLRPESVTPRQLDVNRVPDIYDFAQDNATSKLHVWLKPFVLFKEFLVEAFTATSVTADSVTATSIETTEVTAPAGSSIDYTADTHVFNGSAHFMNPQMLHIQHRVAAAGNSGTFSAGAWRRRPVNHERWNTIPGAVFDDSANTFTLPAGLYWMELFSMGFYVQANVIRLYNVTDSVLVDYGDLGMSNANGGYNNTGSTFRGYVELTATKELAVDHYSSGSRSNDGFGYRGGQSLGGADGIYADYKIWKIN